MTVETTVGLIHGDCLEVMPTLDAESIDAIVTDPPYGLEFMGKEWDRMDTRQPGDSTYQTVANPYGRSRVRHGYGRRQGRPSRNGTTAGPSKPSVSPSRAPTSSPSAGPERSIV